MEGTKEKPGVTYKCTGIIVLVVILASAAFCAAIVIPLFQNIEGKSAKVEIPTTVPGADFTEAETECGKIQGVIEHGIHVFKGIPYAEPPISSLRWKPPILKNPENGNCWKDTFKALAFGNVCTQDMGELIGDEDCLFLNVWTPSLDKQAQLSVMVYIHGGSLQTLNGGVPDGSPTSRLSSDTQTVYVSFNYRLNVFGFLALDLLTSNSSTNSSGNYGFMDQLLVLNWVQKNIRNFGGNPSLVTLFGQSSGGTSVLALLASPLSQGLFHRAWMMSASPILNRTLSQASTDNLIFLDNTNCTDLECLYKLTPKQLMAAIPYDVWPRWGMADIGAMPTKGLFNGALAIVDGYVLHDDPLEVFRAGQGMTVPVMIGSTAQENDIGGAPPDIKTWTWDNYTEHITNKLKPFGDDILERALELYPPSNNVTPEFQLTTLSTDLRGTCSTNVLANALASSPAVRAYRYIVTSHPSTPINVYGNPVASAYAFHTWDSLVFFGGLNTYFDVPSKENLDFKRVQEQEMLHFARQGFPYRSSWLSYPNTTGLLSHTITVVKSYQSEECKFWLENGFFSYGYIN